VFANVTYNAPNGTSITIDPSPIGPWVKSYTCNVSKKSDILNASSSFPSLHAILLAYVSAVVVEYTMFVAYPYFVKKYQAEYHSLIHFICVWFSSIVCFGGFLGGASRFADKYHFIEDIVAGGIMGVAIGMAYFYFDFALLNTPPPKPVESK
jgi:membrane-associated phospholipid phosphatase